MTNQTGDSGQARWPLDPAEIVQIQQAGDRSARVGESVSVCPYRVGTGDGDEVARFRQLMWVRGYRQARGEMEAGRVSRDS